MNYRLTHLFRFIFVGMAAVTLTGCAQFMERLKNRYIGVDVVPPLHESIRKGTTNWTKRLIQDGADIHTIYREDRSAAIHWAAGYGDVKTIDVLLKAGASLTRTDGSGYTPLHWAAAMNSDVNVTKRLIAAGASVRARTGWGRTPLHVAARSNSNVAVLRTLILAGARTYARDNNGKRVYEFLLQNDALRNSREAENLILEN